MKILQIFVVLSAILATYSCGGGNGNEDDTIENNSSFVGSGNQPSAFKATVLEETTNQPIANAFHLIHSRVFAGGEMNMDHGTRTGGMQSEYFRSISGTTDESGAINVTNFLQGDYAIKVSADGYFPIYWRGYSSYGRDGLYFSLKPAPTSLSPDNPYYDFYNILESNPVGYGYFTPRLDGFLLFDTLAETEVWTSASQHLRDFLKVRYDSLIEEVRQPVTELTLWRVANMGAIIKEGDTVFAIDLDMRYSSILDHKLFNEVDYFFATHEHNDHFNGDVALIANQLNKPYYLPADMKSGFEGGEWDQHNSDIIQHTVGVDNGETLNIEGWKIKAKEAAHGSVTNLTYLFESPNGVTILHTGDGSVAEAPDLRELQELANITGFSIEQLLNNYEPWFTTDYQNLDILITAVWQHNLNRVYLDSTPRAFVPMHVQELGHPPTNRWSYGHLSSFEEPSKLIMLHYGDRLSLSDIRQ